MNELGEERPLLKVVRLPREGRRGIDRFSVALIADAPTFPALLAAFHVEEAEYGKSGRCFLTLDDLDQSLYTRGHAVRRHGFDDEVDYPENDTPEAVSEYEAAVFAASVKKLKNPDRAVIWSKLHGTLMTVPEDIGALLELNRNPDLLLDDVHVVQCLPVENDEELLANLTNGYFEPDWTPFQCLAVVQRMCQRHNYAFIGVGAATLGFFSLLDDESERDITALISDLQHLYGHVGSESWQQLGEVLENGRHLILGYSEDFGDLVAEAE